MSHMKILFEVLQGHRGKLDTPVLDYKQEDAASEYAFADVSDATAHRRF